MGYIFYKAIYDVSSVFKSIKDQPEALRVKGVTYYPDKIVPCRDCIHRIKCDACIECNGRAYHVGWCSFGERGKENDKDNQDNA